MNFATVTFFTAALVLVFVTSSFTLLYLLRAIVPFGFGDIPAIVLGATIAFPAARLALRRVRSAAAPSALTLRHIGGAVIIIVAYFIVSMVLGVALLIGLSSSAYFLTVVAAPWLALLAIRFGARLTTGTSGSWTLFGAVVVCALIGVILSLRARTFTDQWAFLLLQQGHLLIAGFWLLGPAAQLNAKPPPTPPPPSPAAHTPARNPP
jgi:hypothetical protein